MVYGIFNLASFRRIINIAEIKMITSSFCLSWVVPQTPHLTPRILSHPSHITTHLRRIPLRLLHPR